MEKFYFTVIMNIVLFNDTKIMQVQDQTERINTYYL